MKQDRYPEKEEEDFGFDFEEEDEFLDDHLCCWDIRYKYGSYCHCKAAQEAHERELHWFYGRWDLFIHRLNNLIYDIKFRLRKRKCYSCKKSFRQWSWMKEDRCPNCGDWDLPF